MIALMPVTCWITDSVMPMVSGLRRPGENTSDQDASPSAASACRSASIVSAVAATSVSPVSLTSARLGLRPLLVADQPAHRLRDAQEPEHQQYTGDHGESEHRPPAPGRRQRIVGQVREEDADRDRELVGRHEPPAQGRRRHLGGVERRDGRREADGDAGDHAA
jgi:hypothetical protein